MGCGLVIVAVGGVASRFTNAESDAEPPSLVALQVKVVPGVSPAITIVSQPVVDVTVLSGSHQAQLSDTLVRNQPNSFGTSLKPYQSWGGCVSVKRNALSIHAKW